MTMNVTTRRVIAAAIVVVAGAATAVAIVRRGGEEPSVLGAKVERCRTDDATVTVAAGITTLTADNAPLTVTVANGRIASVLAPAVRITPGSAEAPRPASLTLGRPQIEGDNLTFDVTLESLSDCAVRVGAARASATRQDGQASGTAIRIGGEDHAVVAPREAARSSVEIPFAGDGTYEVTAAADVEFGLVR